MKFIHDGQVIIVKSIGDVISSFEPILQISHSDDDFFLHDSHLMKYRPLRFYISIEISWPWPCHLISITIPLFMMRGMSFLPSFGLGRHQHVSSKFMTTIDQDTHFGLGFTPLEDDIHYIV